MSAVRIVATVRPKRGRPLARGGRRARRRRRARRPRARRRAPERAARPGQAGRAAVGGRRAPAAARRVGARRAPRSSPASSARCGCGIRRRACAPPSRCSRPRRRRCCQRPSPPAANRETVRLRSGYDVWRYRYSRPDGSVAFVYAAPTTTGVATVACLGRDQDGACDALASAVVVPDSRRLELGKRAGCSAACPRSSPTSRPPAPRASERSTRRPTRPLRRSPRMAWPART